MALIQVKVPARITKSSTEMTLTLNSQGAVLSDAAASKLGLEAGSYIGFAKDEDGENFYLVASDKDNGRVLSKTFSFNSNIPVIEEIKAEFGYEGVVTKAGVVIEFTVEFDAENEALKIVSAEKIDNSSKIAEKVAKTKATRQANASKADDEI